MVVEKNMRRAGVPALVVGVSLVCGCAMFGPRHTGVFGDARGGVSVALQASRAAYEKGDRIALYAVIRNTGDKPVLLAGSPFVTVGLRVNGKHEGDMIGKVKLARKDVRLSPGAEKTCFIEKVDTSRLTGTLVFSGAVSPFPDRKLPVATGALTVEVK